MCGFFQHDDLFTERQRSNKGQARELTATDDDEPHRISWLLVVAL
jgi:hypothetical protein